MAGEFPEKAQLRIFCMRDVFPDLELNFGEVVELKFLSANDFSRFEGGLNGCG